MDGQEQRPGSLRERAVAIRRDDRRAPSRQRHFALWFCDAGWCGHSGAAAGHELLVLWHGAGRPGVADGTGGRLRCVAGLGEARGGECGITLAGLWQDDRRYKAPEANRMPECHSEREAEYTPEHRATAKGRRLEGAAFRAGALRTLAGRLGTGLRDCVICRCRWRLGRVLWRCSEACIVAPCRNIRVDGRSIAGIRRTIMAALDLHQVPQTNARTTFMTSSKSRFGV